RRVLAVVVRRPDAPHFDTPPSQGCIPDRGEQPPRDSVREARLAGPRRAHYPHRGLARRPGWGSDLRTARPPARGSGHLTLPPAPRCGPRAATSLAAREAQLPPLPPPVH